MTNGSNPPPGDPVWKRPGHFDRFEFKNKTAVPQTLTKLHFEFRDKDDGLVCLVEHIDPALVLQPDGMWGWTPPPTEAYGDAVKFTGYVELAAGGPINFDFQLVGKPPYSYIWVARLGLDTDPVVGLIGYGEVECMEPHTVQVT